MKKLITLLIVVSLTIMPLYGCGNTKVIDGVEYDTYGLVSKGETRNPNIKYKVIIGNIIWSCILVETIIAPIYFLGFSLYEPTRKVVSGEPKGII